VSPYVVTTKRGHWSGRDDKPDPFSVSRRAVATLEEDELKRRLFNWREGDRLNGREQRILDVIWGQVSNPLPDGTVIQVERTTWAQLGEAANEDWWIALAERTDEGNEPARQTILDAYNARQS
jgi:hypothetical protein